jgi:hypothetical protein
MVNLNDSLINLEVQLGRARARLAKYKPGGSAYAYCVGTIASLEARIEALQEDEIETYSNLIVLRDG